MTEAETAWLAGLLEGEGYFGHRTAPWPQVRITTNMTDEDVLRRAFLLAGVGHLNGPYQRTDNGKSGHKPYWTWCVSKKSDVVALAKSIYPYMGDRRRASLDAILNCDR